jgi:hypothetical protein
LNHFNDLTMFPKTVHSHLDTGINQCCLSKFIASGNLFSSKVRGSLTLSHSAFMPMRGKAQWVGSEHTNY